MSITHKDILAAFEAGNLDYLKKLVVEAEVEALEDGRSSDLNTAFADSLAQAISTGNRDFIWWVICNKPSQFNDEPPGYTLPALCVAMENDMQSMAMILRYGPEDACISYTDHPGVLEYAIAYGDDRMVAMLLAAGCERPHGIYLDYSDYLADVNTTWEEGENLVEYCQFRINEVAETDPAKAEQYRRIADMLAKAAEMDRHRSYDPAAALYSACSSGDLQRIEKILNDIEADVKCDYNIDGLTRDQVEEGDLSSYFDTPLTVACMKGQMNAVKLLLLRGANPNVTSPSFHTPLQLAIQRGDVGIVKLLIVAGADVNCCCIDEDDEGDHIEPTPLEYARSLDHTEEIVKVLLVAGAH